MPVNYVANYCIRAFQKKQQLILVERFLFYPLIKVVMCYIIGLVLYLLPTFQGWVGWRGGWKQCL